MQYACILEGLLVVPILDGTPEHQVDVIVERCKPGIIITCSKRYEIVKSVLSKKTIDKENILRIPPAIVILSSPAQIPFPLQDRIKKQEEREQMVSSHDSNKAYSAYDISKLGKRMKYVMRGSMKVDDDDPSDNPRMLIPTSGSSGTPKLIIVSDAMIMQQFVAPRFGVRMVMYSFQPVRQSFDLLIKGGRMGVWSGDLSHLHHDMTVLRPTHFGSTPVFWMAQIQTLYPPFHGRSLDYIDF